MSSRSNLSIGLAGIQSMQSNIVQTYGQALPPVGSPPLAPPVVPASAPTTPSGEKGTEATDGGKSNTMLYVGIGVGVVVLVVVAYFIFRK